jgi:hypothetical protein
MRHAPPGKHQQLPTHGVPEYQRQLKHKNIYGGVSSVSVLGMTLIIFHDKQAAHNLLGQAMRYTRECGIGSLRTRTGLEGVGGGVYWGSEGGREAPGKTCGGGAGEACGAFQDVSGSVYLVCSRGTRF